MGYNGIELIHGLLLSLRSHGISHSPVLMHFALFAHISRKNIIPMVSFIPPGSPLR